MCSSSHIFHTRIFTIWNRKSERFFCSQEIIKVRTSVPQSTCIVWMCVRPNIIYFIKHTMKRYIFGFVCQIQCGARVCRPTTLHCNTCTVFFILLDWGINRIDHFCWRRPCAHFDELHTHKPFLRYKYTRNAERKGVPKIKSPYEKANKKNPKWKIGWIPT